MDYHRYDDHNKLTIKENELSELILKFSKEHLRQRKGSLIYPPSLYYVFLNYEKKKGYKGIENIDINKALKIFEEYIFKEKPEYIEYYEKKCFVDWEYFNIDCPKGITIRIDIKLKKYFENGIMRSPSSFLNRDELIQKTGDWFYSKTGKKINKKIILEEFNKFAKCELSLQNSNIGYRGFKFN
jgi:hypothetical protein